MCVGSLFSVVFLGVLSSFENILPEERASSHFNIVLAGMWVSVFYVTCSRCHGFACGL